MTSKIALLCVFLASVALTETVDRVVDGDTFVLSSGDKVRLIGVDCPETQGPNGPGEYFAAEAGDFLDSLIADASIRLEFDGRRTDRYGRLLCYVWLDDSILVNKEIVRQGYGMAYLRYPHRLEAEFLEAELAARRAAIGMWASPRAWSQKTLKERYGEMLRDTTSSGLGGTTDEKEKTTNTSKVTVYITRTGSKYHRASCSYLRKSKTAITREEAIVRGYEPCKRCKP